jgi:hypothetical protein
MPDAVDLDAAAQFLWRHARLVERRLYLNRFAGAQGAAVVVALRGYQNDDGGFGHALEPDLRGPDSQPIHVDMALRILHAAAAHAPEMVARACSYLAAVGPEPGAVPAIFPSVDGYPRAEHWQWQNWPAQSLNPTAMIAGLLHGMRVGHPWLDAADAFCWRRLAEATAVDDGPALAAVFCFLNHAPDRKRAVAMAEQVAGSIPEATFFTLQPGAASSYALTPLDLAPTPESMACGLFADELLAAHLDQLEDSQQADGGWPITWDPPSETAALEWRGRVTLDALLTLQAYGRLEE